MKDTWEEQFAARTDKFGNGYWPLYQQVIAMLPARPKILELGVYHGGSLELWRAIFPAATLAGLDCNRTSFWPEGTFKLLGGQTCTTLAAGAREIAPDGWDMIVDDCSHIGTLSEKTFRLYWPQVAAGGWYVYEDWAIGHPASPYYDDIYEWDKPLDLAKSFVDMLGSPGHGGIDEMRSRHGITALRKA